MVQDAWVKRAAEFNSCFVGIDPSDNAFKAFDTFGADNQELPRCEG